MILNTYLKQFAMNKREKTIHIKATLFGLSGLKISLHVIKI